MIRRDALQLRDPPSGVTPATVAAELLSARRSVAVVALAAIAVGLAMSYRLDFPLSVQSRSHTVGVGSALVLVDTPRSQVVDLAPSSSGGIDVLSARARLLATLMVTPPISGDIARGAGLTSDELITMRPSTLTDRRRRVPAPQVTTVAEDDPRAHILHVAVNPLPEGEHPIIAVDTQAPDATAAGRLANQAIASLRARLDAEVQSSREVPADRRVVIRQLDPPELATVRLGPNKLLVLGGVLTVFVAGCAAIVLTRRLRWRPARAGQTWRSDPLRRMAGRAARRLS